MTEETRPRDSHTLAGELPLALVKAGLSYEKQGAGEGLIRWLDRALGSDGIPRRGDVSEWWEWLEELDRLRRQRERDWPDETLPAIDGLLRAVMRWSRPGGAPLFVDRPEPKSRGELVWSWLRVLEDASLRTVAEWWFGADATNPRGQKQSPLLPAFAANQRALAILRPDWNAGGDLIGIDHPRGGECRLELVGQGRSWLGPNWPGLSHATGPTALREYSHGPWADLAEWSVRDGAGRAVTRTAILLRGEKAALLAQEHRGVKPGEWVTLRIPLWNGVLPQRVTGSRALELRGSRRAVAHLLPISLPDHDSVIEGGEFKLDGRNVLLRVRARGSRVWLPLFISWDRTRPLNWRVLTITRDTKRIRPDQAFAVRVSRGAGKSLVIYRSLGKPVMRTFLGHQSEARLLLASFDREGELKPLLKLGAEETED